MNTNLTTQLFLDDVDLVLLREMQRNSDLRNVDLARRAHISPPTCLRRINRLRNAGLIERQIAILNPQAVRNHAGLGLIAIAEVTLDRQDAASWEGFERKAATEPMVQQCYRVSPGPDFILVVHAAQMPDYLALTQRLFTQDANVRNVKTFFSIQRSKFGAEIPLA